MDSMEEGVRKKVRRARISNAILLTLYGVSALSLIAMAPNAARLLKFVEPPGLKKRDITSRLKESAQKLVRGGLLVSANGKYELTDKGRTKAMVLQYSMQNTKKKKRWDKHWRIIIFDIWERRRDTRYKLRQMLQNVGFVRLQDSVWVYPYPCEDLVTLIRTDLKLGTGMLYIIAEGIENDKHLRKHFALP